MSSTPYRSAPFRVASIRLEEEPVMSTKMAKTSIFIFCLIAHNSLYARDSDSDIVIGRTISIHSDILDEERSLFISLPTDYHRSDNRYPTLFTLDAERYFESTVTLVRFLSEYGHMPPMIVVGVPNTDRSRDFSHRTMEGDPKTGADRFLAFLGDELIPYIDGRYRTMPYRVIKGWCATGIFSIYTLFTRPELFDAYFAASPYLVNDATFMFDLVGDYPKDGFTSPRFLYMSVGGRDRPDTKTEAPKFAKLFERKSFDHLDWHFSRLPIEDHMTIDFKTFHLGLETMYSELLSIETLLEPGLAPARQKLSALARKYGYDAELPEQTLIQMGEILLNRVRVKDAITLFKHTVEAYPESWNAHDSLAEAYLNDGQNDLAIAHYRKSLELNPKHENAAEMLKELNEQEGTYFSQKPPGLKPAMFARGIISRDAYELGSVYSPDLKEFIHVTVTEERGYVLWIMRYEDGRWSEPFEPSFSKGFKDVDPSYSPDGRFIFFACGNRPGGHGEMDIWYVERRGNGWSEVRNAGPEVNSSASEVHAVMTATNALYFASERTGNKDIYRAEFLDDRFTRVKNLGHKVNSDVLDSDCYVDPAESFLIFHSLRKGGYGDSDFYISFRDADGWSKAVNMGADINDEKRVLCPALSPDGKYLFYTRRDSAHII
jgi:predicted alpha/beta superfamily hydrolase